MQTFDQWTQEFRDLAARPRVANRAKAHMITMQELATFYPDLKGKTYEQWKERFSSYHTGEEYPAELLNNLLSILQQRNADLKRGDFVFIEFDLGYRNDGKVMFNEQHIIELATDPYDYGMIPEEFQIGEFPPRYWIDLINNTWIPFDMAERLPQLTINNVRLLPRRDGTGIHMIVPFQTPLGLMAIVELSKMQTTSSPEINAQHFIEEIGDEHYFHSYDLNHSPFEEDILSLPEGYSYENLIFYLKDEDYEY